MNWYKRNLLFAWLLLAITSSYAQKTKSNPAQPVKNATRDTFAFNLLSTVDKVLRIAADPGKPVMLLAGELVRTEENGAGIYQAAYILPGSLRSEFRFAGVRRYQNKAWWSWEAVMIDEKASNDTMHLHNTKLKIREILRSFADRCSDEMLVQVSDNVFIDLKYRPDNILKISVDFARPVHNTREMASDSLVRLYKPLLKDRATAGACTKRFAKAFQLEDAESMCQQALAGMIREIADHDIKAAYQVLLHVPYFVKPVPLKELLSPSQQEQIVRMANETIAETEKIFAKGKPDPVVVQKKKVEQEQPPTEPCAREIWELSLKPGTYISGKNQTGYIVTYSCSTNTYTIAWLDAAKQKLFFDKNVTVGTMNTYSFTSASPFIVCSHCNGIGYSNEYDWYQMGVGSNFYARSNDLRKYTCGVCKGSGFIKVR